VLRVGDPAMGVDASVAELIERVFAVALVTHADGGLPGPAGPGLTNAPVVVATAGAPGGLIFAVRRRDPCSLGCQRSAGESGSDLR
jgi:hypothetical protein